MIYNQNIKMVKKTTNKNFYAEIGHKMNLILW